MNRTRFFKPFFSFWIQFLDSFFFPIMIFTLGRCRLLNLTFCENCYGFWVFGNLERSKWFGLECYWNHQKAPSWLFWYGCVQPWPKHAPLHGLFLLSCHLFDILTRHFGWHSVRVGGERACELAILFGSGEAQRAGELAIEWRCRHSWQGS